MAEIRTHGGRLYSVTSGSGIIVHKNELALLESSVDGIAFVAGAAVGAQSYEPDSTGSATVTPDGRLRVDSVASSEGVNVFASASPWNGWAWELKSPW